MELTRNSFPVGSDREDTPKPPPRPEHQPPRPGKLPEEPMAPKPGAPKPPPLPEPTEPPTYS